MKSKIKTILARLPLKNKLERDDRKNVSYRIPPALQAKFNKACDAKKLNYEDVIQAGMEHFIEESRYAS